MLHHDHPFIVESELGTLEGLTSYPQIIQRSTLPSDSLKGVLNDKRIWRVSDSLAKKELINSGLGWGRLPYHMVKKELEDGVFISLAEFIDIIQVDLHIGRRVGERYGEVLESFWNMFAL